MIYSINFLQARQAFQNTGNAFHAKYGKNTHYFLQIHLQKAIVFGSLDAYEMLEAGQNEKENEHRRLKMSAGMLILTTTAVLVVLGIAQRVLDRMRLDRSSGAAAGFPHVCGNTAAQYHAGYGFAELGRCAD